MLRPNSPNRGLAEQILLEEMKKFEEQEDKTLNIHEPHRLREKTRSGIDFNSDKHSNLGKVKSNYIQTIQGKEGREVNRPLDL